MSTKQESKTTVSHLPEHGPIDENGREILLQVKNVDITFGKGDDAVKAVKNASFDIYKGRSEERRVGKECRSRWSPYH